MNSNDILLLVKAGYTRDEISQMDAQNPVQSDAEPVPVDPAPQDPEPVPAQADQPVAVPPPVPASVPVPQQVSADAQPSMADLMQSIAKLTSAVQANAIANSVIPQGMNNPVTAEDMLAEIIRPTFKERG